MKKLALTLALVSATSAITGCGFLKSLVGKNSVDLEGAEVKNMSVALRSDKRTICPRERVQLGVYADVTLRGDKETKRLQTYVGGPGANKNDKMEFTDFAFRSDQGTFDEHGFFMPAKASVISTAAHEFEIQTAYKRDAKQQVTAKYKPDYACIKMAGGLGEPGAMGDGGQSGQAGSAGQYGGSDRVGGNGSDGGPGGPGTSGGDGAAGPRVQVFATLVKTPFYDKLVAIKIDGDVQDFVLVPADQPVTIKATGGPGGSGGAGGAGGNGGAGGSGVIGGDGGSGGQGGIGGNGGRGGPGGSIDFVYDAKYPELANLVVLDAAGGAAGAPGEAGRGGSAGSAGSGTGTQPQSGRNGTEGPHGAGGAPGQKGPDGRAVARAGSVGDRFADVSGAGIALLDAAPSPAVDAVADTKDLTTPKTSKKTKTKKASRSLTPTAK